MVRKPYARTTETEASHDAVMRLKGPTMNEGLIEVGAHLLGVEPHGFFPVFLAHTLQQKQPVAGSFTFRAGNQKA